MNPARQIKLHSIKRMSKSVRRLTIFNKLDDIEIEHLLKAYRNMTRKSFKIYLVGFLDARRLGEEVFVVVDKNFLGGE